MAAHRLSAFLLLAIFILSVPEGTLSLQFNVINDKAVYRFSSSETSPDTTQFGTVACTEAGGGALTGDVVYVISDNRSPSLPFQLDQQTGELTLASGNTLDFETIPHYLFNVSCNYVSQPTITASATVEFSVLPVNEYLPDIQNPSVSITISEATPVDTVLASTDSSGTVQYTVTDMDSGYGGELRFLAGSNNPAGFSIDEMTGAITLTQSLDLDTSNVRAIRLTLLIGVCDGDRIRSECPNQEISVIVIPSNDNVPQFEQSEYDISFSESTPVGSSLIDIVCSDDDRFVGVFQSISIVPTNGSLHIPNTTNGTVILRQPLDYESGSTLTVSLVCRDSGFPVLDSNAILVVNILPENDSPPQFNQSSYEFSTNRISVLGERIGSLAAMDLDGSVITYTLFGQGSENFIIRPDGVLVTVDFLFVVEGRFFELTVVASDGNSNTSAKVRININGVISIPEIIIAVGAGVLLFVCIIIVIVISCCCCIGCYRCLPKQKEKTYSDEDMVGMNAMDYAHHMPLPTMFDHGGPIYQIGQIPQQMEQDWNGSHDMLESEEGDNGVDMVLGSVPSSSRVYTPGSTLKEIVDYFHEGDKVLDGKKKGKKSSSKK